MRDEAKIKLRESLRGSVIERGAANYDEARALYNGMIDKHPLLIARCVDVADVIAAVNFGRDNGLRIAIRGGGHNGPGLASVDDGLVIDLSDVPYVDLSGVATLLETLRVARARKTGLQLKGLHDRPLYLLEVTGLLSLFDTCGINVRSIQKAQ